MRAYNGLNALMLSLVKPNQSVEINGFSVESMRSMCGKYARIFGKKFRVNKTNKGNVIITRIL